MKALLTIILSLCLTPVVLTGQQYYLRGEVRDEKGVALQNVNILQQSSGFIYHSGSMGGYGILSRNRIDTLTFSMDGYFKETVVVKADDYVVTQLKLMPVVTTVKRDKLASLTKDLARDLQHNWFTGDETYASIIENKFIDAGKYPTTGVALNIDKASYSNIRRFISMNTPVPPDAVRIEEMLNYFNFGYTKPEKQAIFKVNSTLTTCPWNKDNQLFFVNVCSKKLDLDSLTPANFVFLIDISGSMDMPNRLPLLKSAFHLLADNLREIDTVSIVVYGGVVGIMLQPTAGNNKEKIHKAIDELQPGGSTPGESGISIAYGLAKNHFIKKGNNRVILATDGDFNVGVQSEDDLDEMISRNRESGIYLTCLGIGMGNYKDSKIQTLARKGNGNFAYIDGYQEAEKVLLKEYTQTLYAVADDVYMNICFSPGYVKEYRLIGYDNKVAAITDTLSGIDGGEIGSGHSSIAAFEIVPAVPSNKKVISSEEFAKVSLRFRLPEDTTVRHFVQDCRYEPVKFSEAAPATRFATAVIAYGSLLRLSQYVKDINWDAILVIAGESANKEDVNQEQFIDLVEKTKLLYSKSKKKKRREKEEE